MVRGRLRGIYATALTERLAETVMIVDPSEAIDERFDHQFEAGVAELELDDAPDRRGVGVTGPGDAVDAVRASLTAIARDAVAWTDPTPRGATFEATVTETLGSGAVVDLGSREGFLPYDSADQHVESGDQLRVQVREPVSPWAAHRPEVATGLEATAGPVSLVRGGEHHRAEVIDDERASELVRSVDLLSTAVPDGWIVRFEAGAAGADLSVLDEALALAAERAAGVLGTLEGEPAPLSTTWIWFGRESRFALDEIRRAVTTTMPGHHRIKAGSSEASGAVDFVEALWNSVGADGLTDGEFPFAVIADQFGPAVGDELTISHGKPDGRRFPLGTGEVTGRDEETVTLRRQMTAGGQYDGLDVERSDGDVAVTRLTEGNWWYPTVYQDPDGSVKGTYVNVCTPLEIFPDAATYLDLEVDVVKHADGSVDRLDDDELEAAVSTGYLSSELAEKAREVATSIEAGLRE